MGSKLSPSQKGENAQLLATLSDVFVETEIPRVW